MIGKVNGFFEKTKETDLDHSIQEKQEAVNNKFKYNLKNKLLKQYSFNDRELLEETLDEEIYAKFLMFLQFKERIKKDSE